MKIFGLQTLSAVSLIIHASESATTSSVGKRTTRFLETKTTKSTKSTKSSKAATHPCARIVADEIGWSNWYHSVSNPHTPVFRVKSDKDLRDILKASRKKKSSDDESPRCTVRPAGSGHSHDGMVMQRTEMDTVLVSLIDHVPEDSAWSSPSVNADTGRVRLLAGQSWYEAVALYRHHGLIMSERTLGRFFSVGGVIANPVHGGSKEGGFIHSLVTKMLVMKSDGKTTEIEGDELKYWRSSGGHLGIILAVEMQLVKETEKGGTLAMKNTVDDFSYVFVDASNPTPEEIGNLVGLVTQKVLTTVVASDHQEFFYDYYANTLASFYTDFSGPPFDAALAAQYKAAAELNLQTYGEEVAITGGAPIPIPDDLCSFFCVPGTGNPPTGDGSTPCVPITIPGTTDLLCNDPFATAAAFVQYSISSLKQEFETTASTVNDGYFNTHQVTDHSLISISFPSRAFSQIFATWWGVHARALQFYSTPNSSFQYIPNNVLEFRFINPMETAMMNPTIPFAQIKANFDNEYFNSFDSFFPPVQGVPDGLIIMETLNIKGVNDDDYAKYFAFLEQAWHHTPSNPLAPYGNNTNPLYGPIIPKCDAANSIVLCASANQNNLPPFVNPINNALPCCNPPVPINVHIAKGYGFGVDPDTTPTTGQPVPYHNQEIVNKIFASPQKRASLTEFNKMVEKYDADVFKGGALLRWLSPGDSKEFEPRSLAGQTCGSEEYKSNPSSECISNQCNLANKKCL